MKNKHRNKLIVPLIIFIQIVNLNAQDLEPRSLSALPTGGNFAVASYAYSGGNILLDNSLPIDDLDAKANNMVLAYGRSFKLFNRLTKFDMVLPYSFSNFEGVVNNIDSSTYRSGFGDPLMRLSMILFGADPWKPSEYFKHEQKKFKLGVSLRLRLPLGQYDETKFVNLGANRWAVKTALLASYTFHKKLVLETQFNAWFFTENKAFFNGNTIKQKPLISAQLHATYLFKPGIWMAVSVGQSALGETIVNGVEKDDLQNTSRYGAVFAFRLNKQSSLKFGVTSGLSARYGANFTTVLAAYQFMWFDKTKPTQGDI